MSFPNQQSTLPGNLANRLTHAGLWLAFICFHLVSWAVPLAHADPDQTANWPTFGNGPAHTGSQPVTLGSDLYQAGWTVPYATIGLNPVAIEAGTIIVTSQPFFGFPSYISALDANTGLERWRQTIFGVQSQLNPPTITDGKAYVVNSRPWFPTNTPALQCLNAATGQSLWSAPIQSGFNSFYAPTVVQDGVWIAGGNSGGVYGFNTADGSQRFFNGPLENTSNWTPAFYNGVLYTWVGNNFRAHNPVTGTILWSLPFVSNWSDSDTVPAIDHGRAFVANPVALYAIDLAGQTSLWTVEGSFHGTPAVADDIVYMISDTDVQAYGATTGALLGTYATGDSTVLYGQPLITIDTVIVSSSIATYFFDRASFALKQTIPFGGQPALANKVLYLAGLGSSVRSFYPASLPVADLSISQTVSPAQVGYGGTITITLTATNNGPNTALATTVRDTLPNGIVTLVSAIASQGTCTQAGNVITCALGDLPSGASATITITLTSTIAFGTNIQNTATISSAVYETLPADNSSSGTISLLATAVFTQPATAVTATSATLHGLINPQGGPIAAAFGYSVNSDIFTLGISRPSPAVIGSQLQTVVTASPATVTSTMDTPVSAVITGLMPGKTYSYNVIAGVTGGLFSSVTGNVQTFTTLGAADLADLVLSVGTLSPAFTPGTAGYTASVSNATSSLTITPTTADGAATVTVYGAAVGSGSPSNPISLTVGDNSIPVVVTSADGTMSQPYTIVVTRRTPYQDWAAGLGLGGTALDPSGDFNGDGLKNILKWAFLTGASSGALGPIQVNAGTLTIYGTPTLISVPDGGGGTQFFALFGRRADAAGVGLTYTVEFSADLSAWIPSTDTPTVVAQDVTIQAVTVPFPALVNGVPPKYFHVKVTGQ